MKKTTINYRLPTTDYRLLITILFLLLLAAALRFHHLDAQSFWNDEGNSARLSERSIPLIIEGTAGDIHPPLYYLMLRGWREGLGETEFGLRALSAFLGIGVVALTYTLARQLQNGRRGEPLWPPSANDNNRAPTANEDGYKTTPPPGSDGGRRKSRALPALAALLTAVNPALIYYSQEARMYQLLAFLGMLSTVLLVHWLKTGARLKSITAVFYISSASMAFRAPALISWS